ncbi:MAG: PepSY domain-containing protein [Solirubrobacterales bacterium]
MTRNRKIIAVAAAVAALGGGGAAIASATGVGDDDDGSEQAISGAALDQASAAALEHTGGGTVSDTEVGDEESLYEVEVTLPDGSQTDVQLDEQFNVVGDETDSAGEDEAEGEK